MYSKIILHQFTTYSFVIHNTNYYLLIVYYSKWLILKANFKRLSKINLHSFRHTYPRRNVKVSNSFCEILKVKLFLEMVIKSYAGYNRSQWNTVTFQPYEIRDCDNCTNVLCAHVHVMGTKDIWKNL